MDDYINFINSYSHIADRFVTMDIPCDQRPHITIQKLPNREKIEKTIENTLYIMERVNYQNKIMSVVQGYLPEEYEYCCTLMRQHGIITEVTGIGSLCIRKYTRNAVHDIKTILDTIRKQLPNTKLHAFGLNIRFLLRREIREKLHSSDSAAWLIPYDKYGRITLLRYSGAIQEIDTFTLTRRGRKVELDLETIYFHLMLTYILKLIDSDILTL